MLKYVMRTFAIPVDWRLCLSLVLCISGFHIGMYLKTSDVLERVNELDMRNTCCAEKIGLQGSKLTSLASGCHDKTVCFEINAAAVSEERSARALHSLLLLLHVQVVDANGPLCSGNPCGIPGDV